MDTLNIEKYGFNHTGNIFRNNPPGALVEKALLKKEDFHALVLYV